MQKYITYIVAGFIIYSIYENSQVAKINIESPADKVSAIQDKVVNEENFEGSWFEKKISRIMANVIKTPEGEKFFKNLIQYKDSGPENENNLKFVNKDVIANMFNINTIQVGSGNEAICGSKVKVYYELYDIQNGLVKKEDKTFVLGKGTFSRIMENSVIGMKVGEEREVTLYPNTLKDNFIKSTLKAKINLKSLEGGADSSDIRFFDDIISFEKPILCSQSVKFDLVIMDIAGKIIFKQNAINVTLGDDGVPTAISHGLFGKFQAGTRTLIAKGKTLMGSHAMFASISKLKINPGNFYIIELKNTEIVVE
ncbi:MAG: hypothetical protein K0Q51_1277 [Rickettsiaceae bacterium]|jgi:hypothetical protein|nr:hypothetical protein [Rickettsiaceae bacterium]